MKIIEVYIGLDGHTCIRTVPYDWRKHGERV
jgi:hypothetical protein